MQLPTAGVCNVTIQRNHIKHGLYSYRPIMYTIGYCIYVYTMHKYWTNPSFHKSIYTYIATSYFIPSLVCQTPKNIWQAQDHAFPTSHIIKTHTEALEWRSYHVTHCLVCYHHDVVIWCGVFVCTKYLATIAWTSI